MSHKLNGALAVISIDIGKNSFHLVGHDRRGAIVVRQKWPHGQVGSAARQPATLLDRDGSLRRRPSSQSQAAGLVHDARLMPAKYVRPYSKGQKNDFPEAALLPARSSARTQHNGVLAHERTLPLQTRAGGVFPNNLGNHRE